MNSLVSIIIPAFNAEAFILDSINSVLFQSYQNIEILIIDDCSTDSTSRLVRKIKDRRVFYFKTEKRSGPAFARNIGIRYAKGSYVTLLDADDIYLTDRILVLKKILDNSAADAVADNQYVEFAGNHFLSKKIMFQNSLFDNKYLTFQTLLTGTKATKGKYPISFIKPFFKTSFLKNNLILYNENLIIAQDYMFYAEFLFRGGRLLLANFIGYTYRKRFDSHSFRINSEKWKSMILEDVKFYKNVNLTHVSKKDILFRFHFLLQMYFFEVFVENFKNKNYVKSICALFIFPKSICLLKEPFIKRLFSFFSLKQ